MAIGLGSGLGLESGLGLAPVFLSVSAPIDTPHCLNSLANTKLCGLDHKGRGKYTAERMIKLCEALPGSTVTSLKCAAAPRVFDFVSVPIDTHAALSPSPAPRLQFGL